MEQLVVQDRVKTRMSGPMLAGMLALGLLSTAALAASPNIKPGLWEMQMQGGKAADTPDMAQMQKAMQKMQALMAKMPPEQRKQMEAQMGGMGMSMSGKGVRMCMTEEDIRREDIPLDDGKCETTIKTRTATRWAATSVCTEPPMTSEIEAVFASPVAYTVKVKGTRAVGGHQQPFDMAMSWQHVSADCGAVKSLSAVRAAAAMKKK